MKITKLHYFDTFEIIQGHRRFTKVGFEAELDDEFDDVRDCYYKLKRKSEELFYESKAAAEKQMGTQVTDVVDNGVQKAPIKSQEETIIEGINSTTEIKVLESYRLIATNSKNAAIKIAYESKLKQLQQ